MWKNILNSVNYILSTILLLGASYVNAQTLYGYQNGNLIYMDPELGSLQTAPESYFLKDYEIHITGNK